MRHPDAVGRDNQERVQGVNSPGVNADVNAPSVNQGDLDQQDSRVPWGDQEAVLQGSQVGSPDTGQCYSRPRFVQTCFS